MTRSAPVGVRRALQASAGRARVQGCQRWDRLLAPRKKTPWSRWRRSEGSLDRQPAKDRVALAGNVSNVPNRVPLLHRSSVCAVKRSPTRAAACLNRTRRRESIDSLVLVVERRLSEFGRDASFPLVSGPQGSKSGADSTARQAHNAKRTAGIASSRATRVCGDSNVAIRTVTRRLSLRLSPGSKADFEQKVVRIHACRRSKPAAAGGSSGGAARADPRESGGGRRGRE